MSQFSESLHFRGPPTELLAAVTHPAVPVIVACNELWTTFVFLRVATYHQAPLTETRGIILHWTYAEDHEWSVAIYEDGRRVLGYSQGWDPEPQAGKRVGSLPEAGRLLGLSAFELSALLPMTAADEKEGTSHAFELAASLRLPAYEWLSPKVADRVTGCADCPAVSPVTSARWRCPCCGGEERAPYPPEPERPPSEPGPLLALARRLESALAQAVSSGAIELHDDQRVAALCDDMLENLDTFMAAPNPKASFAEWLLEHPDVSDVFVADDDLWRSLVGPLGRS